MLETITDTTSLLGECPVWCDRTQHLFWTDIAACELLALEPYCTSARIGLDKPADFEGALIQAQSVVAAGLPEERFAGRLN